MAVKVKKIHLATLSDIQPQSKFDRDWKFVNDLITLSLAQYLTGGYDYSDITWSSRSPGAYIIYIPSVRKVYIGHTADIYRRRVKHLSKLKTGQHRNKKLQELYDTNPEMEILFFFYPEESVEAAIHLEQVLLSKYSDHPDLLNVATDARSQLGFKHSEETKVVLKALMKIRTANPAHAKNLSEFHIQRFSVQSERDAQSERIKKAWENPETRARMLEANKLKGRKIVVDGVNYSSIVEASNALNVSVTAVTWRLKSHRHPTWRYSGEDQET